MSAPSTNPTSPATDTAPAIDFSVSTRWSDVQRRSLRLAQSALDAFTGAHVGGSWIDGGLTPAGEAILFAATTAIVQALGEPLGSEVVAIVRAAAWSKANGEQVAIPNVGTTAAECLQARIQVALVALAAQEAAQARKDAQPAKVRTPKVGRPTAGGRRPRKA